MTRTYGRMSTKDFVIMYMQHGFKNKNIGKGIRSTLAIISNLDIRKPINKLHKKVAK